MSKGYIFENNDGSVDQIPRWIKVTKTFSDFSAASLTNTISLTTLPAKSVVHGTVAYADTPFTGGTISAYSVTVEMTITGDLLAAASIFTTPTTPITSNTDQKSGSFTSTQAIMVTATSVTGLLNAATQGSVNIYLLVSQLE